ncbi:MAG: hypothetical protein KAR03_10925 [Candidatus Thorarchaeota archaeon]|nr:hypothetical protein [Candidatus Thorarchaeota archaeon]
MSKYSSHQKKSKHISRLEPSISVEDFEPGQSNEKSLFIYHKDAGVAMYSHEFLMGATDPQLLSGFVGAMASFLSEFLGSEQAQWKTVYGSDTTLIVEGGEWAVGVLAVSRETSELRSKLRIIITEFEATYAMFKETSHFEGGLIGDYEDFVRNVFINDRLTPNTRLWRRPEWRDAQLDSYSLDVSTQIRKLLHFMEEGINVVQASEFLGISISDALQIISGIYWNNLINLGYVPANDDILIPSRDSMGFLLSQNNPLHLSVDTMRVVGKLEGRKDLGTIFSILNIQNTESVSLEVGNLISMGYIQKVTVEHNMVLTNETILNSFIRECKSFLSKGYLLGIIRKTHAEGILKHPWLSKVSIGDDLLVLCPLNEHMFPEELECVYDATLYIMNEMTRLLSIAEDSDMVQSALMRARTGAHNSGV